MPVAMVCRVLTQSSRRKRSISLTTAAVVSVRIPL